MKISVNSIGIENFKSFRTEVVNLSPINVIIGSNSTGKTNLLEGIKFAFDLAAYRSPSDYPFIPYWGYSNAVREGDVDKHIGFSFDISIDSFNIKYKSRVTGVGGSLTFLEEKVAIKKIGGSAVIVVFKEMDDVIFVITTYKSSKISRYIP